jgi:hypothetical protein
MYADLKLMTKLIYVLIVGLRLLEVPEGCHSRLEKKRKRKLALRWE